MNEELNIENYFNEYLKTCDEQYLYFLKTKYKIEEIEDKIKNLNKFINSIKNKNLISIKDYEIIQEFSVSKGGFLSNENRKILYLKIYNIQEDKLNEMLYVSPEKQIDRFHNIDRFKLNVFNKKKKDFNIKENPSDLKVILQDCNRSKIYFILDKYDKNGENVENISKKIKEDLYNFILELDKLNNNIYNYFQGYHDIGLYFYILFLKEKNYSLNVFQRFSEFNLKENLQINPKQNDSDQFMSCVKILKFVIETIDKDFQKKFIDVKLSEYNGLCMFASSWLVTVFTHNINRTEIIFRIFDYIMVNHPLSLYYLIAVIILDLFKKNYDKKIFGSGIEIYKFFQDLNFDELDYDLYINESYKYIKNLDIKNFEKLFNELYVKNFFPIMSEEPLAKKWIMRQNSEDINKDFFYFVKGQWKTFLDLFN